MKPSEALAEYRDLILKAAGALSATSVRVFGSAARGDDTEQSDLDLLVEVPKGTTLLDMIGLQQELESALGLKVDVVTPYDLPERVRARVLAEARAV